MVGYNERYDGLDRQGDKKKQKKKITATATVPTLATTTTMAGESGGIEQLFSVCWGRSEIGFDEFAELILGVTERCPDTDLRVIEKMLEFEDEAWETGCGGLDYSIDELRRTVLVEGITGGTRDVADIQGVLGGLLARVGEMSRQIQ
ncbi:hypothetical protein PICMEDRAFT_139397 [Pichia membranifaciens NRRL Y-2026]|uniref:Uncharacterized protein n=1 Tax=Pichia membranifaciens NRRL Y-2026 TaxID=763406 RepID=A0A1E3NLE4_9ASCO|nr:hypothetical protein PICMEDRAFT_139397 [Pichia membranifaciens NRRL Y-2026]ODQ46940.1 hypothetical protein PICMEDRAFT_139397 [Pichia membranifaciens NRRL Y-2026]